eukprot:m.160238 g.160238  ORF g.160238 m.160238 type:complete len:232 (-) comp31177_c0_seq1:2273-2968(-)
MAGTHTSLDGIIWKQATFKGSTVWARVASLDATTVYTSTSDGKACVKYKNTPEPKLYWVSFVDLIELCSDDAVAAADADDGGVRRSRRRRPIEEVEREEEEENALPRPAQNGKLYGIVEGSESRNAYARGKDLKKNCAKCDAVLTQAEHIGFIEATRSKTVNRSYGDAGTSWKKQFLTRERNFFHIACWEVPKSAQKSLRGFIDVVGYEDCPDNVKELIKARVPLVHVDED